MEGGPSSLTRDGAWAPCLQCTRCRFAPWVGKILWKRKWQPTLVFLPGKSQGQRSLGATVHGVTKELDMVE